jgi:DNA processing protein
MRIARPSDDAAAWLALALTPGVGPRTALTLVERLGSPVAVLGASAAALEAAGAAKGVAGALGGAAGRAQAEAAKIVAVGASLVTWADASYPDRLRQIPDPPLTLAVRGRLEPGELAVAMVGARRASEYGRRVAEDLARGLAQAGVTVVSGLAAGIDGAAHRGALDGAGRTIGVLGTGIDRVYPTWHADLAAEIAVSGALVSELPCGTPPTAFNFPRRNRVISGMSAGVVVVEAAAESGSLITARLALEQDRCVFAVPGPVGRTLQHGPHRLIRDGATLVTCVEDVLAELAPMLVSKVDEARRAKAEAALGTSERQLLSAMSADAQHVDMLVGRAGLPAGAALETLLALELRGLVEQCPGKRFRRKAA